MSKLFFNPENGSSIPENRTFDTKIIKTWLFTGLSQFISISVVRAVAFLETC